ncbi:MAG TPA: pitrilysin family protein [Polyangia bacterium]|nr:pitrilysin family protein [Polyangia bacterium]
MSRLVGSSLRRVALGYGLGLAACASAPPPPAAPPPVVAPPPIVVAPPLARQTPDAPFRAQPPGPGPETPFAVPTFKRFKLRSGLEVVLAEFHDLPLVELNLVVKVGGAANPPELAGLADMTRRMLDEGTKTRTAPAIADELATLGAVLGGGSGWDSSNASLSVLTKNLEPALAVFADVVTAPAFDDKEFARVRDNQLTAITHRKDSPPTVASLAFSRVLYGPKHPYGWPMTGVEASLRKMTPANLRAFYAASWRPNNAVLIVAGDVTEDTLRPKLEAAFKGWRSRRFAARRLSAPAPAAAATKIFLIDKADAPQSSIRVGLVSIERSSPDYFPVMLMNTILGGGFYRLDMNLREGKGWTYGARSSVDPRKTPGPFSAGGEFVAAHSAESVGEIFKEVNGMRDADVTDAELQRAKDQTTKSFPARFATRGQVAAQLADIAVFGLPDDYLATFTKKIGAVTKDDVRRVARKYLDPGRLAIVVVGDQRTLAEPLAKIAPVEVRDLEGNPLALVPPGAPAGGTGGMVPGPGGGEGGKE